MRIALILPGGVGRDGVHLVIPALLSLIARLARDHELLVIALDQEEAPASYDLCGARVVCLGREPQDRPGPAHGPAMRYARLLAVLRPFRPALLHAFWMGGTSMLALLAGRAIGAPVVVSLGGGELVGLRTIGYGGQLRAGTRLYAALATAGAARLTAGSRYALGPLRRRRPDARWLPLGVEPGAAALEQAAGPPWRLVQIASISPVKGPELLLRALALARAELRAQTGAAEPLSLDWLGQDELRGAIQRMAAELGLGAAVRFGGWQPHAVALAHCRQAQLYVQSSYHESQGVAVCEAAAAGLPIVGTAVGLVAELAPTAALATPPGDAAALAGAIVALLRDRPRRLALGAAARAWALAHDADWTAAQFAQIYTGLAPRRKEPR